MFFYAYEKSQNNISKTSSHSIHSCSFLFSTFIKSLFFVILLHLHPLATCSVTIFFFSLCLCLAWTVCVWNPSSHPFFPLLLLPYRCWSALLSFTQPSLPNSWIGRLSFPKTGINVGFIVFSCLALRCFLQVSTAPPNSGNVTLKHFCFWLWMHVFECAHLWRCRNQRSLIYLRCSSYQRADFKMLSNQSDFDIHIWTHVILKKRQDSFRTSCFFLLKCQEMLALDHTRWNAHSRLDVFVCSGVDSLYKRNQFKNILIKNCWKKVPKAP